MMFQFPDARRSHIDVLEARLTPNGENAAATIVVLPARLSPMMVVGALQFCSTESPEFWFEHDLVTGAIRGQFPRGGSEVAEMPDFRLFSFDETNKTFAYACDRNPWFTIRIRIKPLADVKLPFPFGPLLSDHVEQQQQDETDCADDADDVGGSCIMFKMCEGDTDEGDTDEGDTLTSRNNSPVGPFVMSEADCFRFFSDVSSNLEGHLVTQVNSGFATSMLDSDAFLSAAIGRSHAHE